MGATESILAGDVEGSSLPPQDSESQSGINNAEQNQTRSIVDSRSLGPNRVLRKNRIRKIQKEGNRNFSEATESVIELRGCILGSSGTGKTALFHRLCGKDPFCIEKNDKGNEEIEAIQTIPWTGEDRISKASVNLYDGKLIGKSSQELDFVILCIDPMRAETFEDAKTFSQHLMNLQPWQLKNLNGFSVEKNGSKNDVDDIEKKGKFDHPPSLSICFMLNFKDLSSRIDQTNPNHITFQTIQTFVTKLQLQLRSPINKASMPKQKKTNVISTFPSIKYQIYALESSMKNCYGLLPLHNFIQIPYHNRKEAILQKQLQQLTASRMKASIRLQTMLQQQDYNKFLDLLSSSNITQPTKNNKNLSQNQEALKKDNSVKSHPPVSKSKPSLVIDEIPAGDKVPRDTLSLHQTQSTTKEQKTSPKPFEKRRITKPHVTSITTDQKSSNQPMHMYDPNQTLEDFFADDDDDDGGIRNHAAIDKNKESIRKSSLNPHKQHQINDNKDDDDENDDEDDFYYDLEGRKIETLGKSQSQCEAQISRTSSDKKEINKANTLKTKPVLTNSTMKSVQKQIALKPKVEKEERSCKTGEAELQNDDHNTITASKDQKTKKNQEKDVKYSNETIMDEKKEMNKSSVSDISADDKNDGGKEFSETTSDPNSKSDSKSIHLSERIDENSLNESVEHEDVIDGWSDDENISLILDDDDEANEGESHDMNEPSIATTNFNQKDAKSVSPSTSLIHSETKLNKSEVMNDVDASPQRQNKENETYQSSKDSNASESWSDDDDDVGFILEEEIEANDYDNNTDNSKMKENTHSISSETKLNVQPTMSKEALAAIALAEKELMASIPNNENKGSDEKKKKKKKKKTKNKKDSEKLKKVKKEKKK